MGRPLLAHFVTPTLARLRHSAASARPQDVLPTCLGDHLVLSLILPVLPFQLHLSMHTACLESMHILKHATPLTFVFSNTSCARHSSRVPAERSRVACFRRSLAISKPAGSRSVSLQI